MLEKRKGCIWRRKKRSNWARMVRDTLLLGSMYFWSWLIQLNRSYKYNENIARTGISNLNGYISISVQNFENLKKTRCNYFLSALTVILSVIGFRQEVFFWRKKYCGSPQSYTSMSELLTQGLPLVAKFSNMCHFRHFLRVPRKTWPKTTGLPWKI